MKKHCLWFFLFVVGIAFIVGGIPSVYAQEDEADEFQLEEIVVTAQKRAENQQKVAITMDVISAEDIKSLGKRIIY